MRQSGQPEEARAVFRRALAMDPAGPEKAKQIAWELATNQAATKRNGPLALYFAQVACEAMEYQDVACLDALAAAYAEVGRFDEAEATLKRAMSLIATGRNAELAGAITRRLHQYEMHQAFRQNASKSP
jgi:Flp pilus assembly protein TadD